MILVQVVADGRLGGGTTHVLQLIEAVRATLPVEVHLISQADSPALAAGAEVGATIHGLDFFRSRLDPALWLRLHRLVRGLRPHLIHAHGARAALPMTLAAQGTPLIYSVHGFHFVGKPWPTRLLALLAERACARRAARVIFICEHDRDLAERSGIVDRAHACQVIANGVEIEELPRATGSADGRELAFLGRLNPQKDPLLLLEILRCLRDQRYRLCVIGDGPLRHAMSERARTSCLTDQVRFLGSLPHKKALERLAGCDVLVLPSLWEGMPIAALEAMAIGVPVVASRVGGVTEMIEDGVTGLLVGGRDPEAFAQGIRRLSATPGLRAAIVARAREAVAERFSWTVAQRAHLDVYRRALALP